MEANPQLERMMSDPETIRAMSTPANLQAMVQMQNAMQQRNQVGGSAPGGVNAGGAGAGDANLMNMLNMMRSGGSNATNPAATAATNPGELYASQIEQLQDMGFTSREQNIRALQASMGNVNAAVERILTGLS